MVEATQNPLVQKFLTTIIDPIIQLLFAAAVVYFVWGVYKYLISSEGGDDRSRGKQHILWSTIGLFIMISVWGIIAVIRSTFGITG